MLNRLPFTRLFIALILYCLGDSLSGRAQDSLHTPGHVSISSPNAASLGKYGDIPVGYHTGTPQISIPLYTVKAGNLSLPIGLSYHASGLKVMEPASWVGAGWSLNAGGVITRTVMGLPDERGTNAGSVEEKGHFSDYGYNNYMYSSGQEDWIGFGAGRKDGEPDLFFFNFGGYSGKFYFRDDRTPVLVPQQDLKIVPYFPADTSQTCCSYVTGDASIQGFTVTTPDGTQYFFGRTPGFTGTAPIEVTNSYTAQAGGGGYIISGWYLNKIQSADGQFSINLNYAQENYGYFTLSTFPINPQVSSGTWGAQYGYNLVKNLITGVRLSSITFPNGTVSLSGGAVRTDLSSNYPYVFADSTNTQAMTLGSLQIADSGTFCKKYKFFYGYFIDSTTGQPGYYGTPGVFTLFTDKKRLRLDSVQEISCDSVYRVPPYKFAYYAEQVPRRITFAQDHWGFYNGATGNSQMIPTYTLNGSVVNGANRDASWPAMRGGALTQITYPTGGTTNLNFEPHYLSSYHYSTGTGTLINLVANMYGQFTDTAAGNFTTNGTLITLDLNNQSTYTAYFKVTDASNAVVYNTSIGNNTHLTFTFTLAAGTYHAMEYIPVAPQYAGGGLQAQLQQITSDTTLYNIVVGGLRIQSVVTNDGLGGPAMTTSYGYTNPGGMSTGVLYSVPTYVQQVRNDLIANIGYFDMAGGGSFQVNAGNINGCPSVNGGDYFVSGGSIRPMSSVQGNHFGYQTVTVSQSGNGYSVYNYYTTTSGYSGIVPDVCVRTATVGSGCITSTPNYPSAPAPFDYKRGELYYEQHYSNSGQLLKDIYYYPVFDASAVLSTPAFIVQQHNTGASNLLLGTKYELSTVRKVKMLTMEDDYSAAGGVYVTKTNTIYYGSAFHNQPTRTVTSTSTGDSLVQTIKYAFDFRIPGCDSISDCSQAYNTSCASCQTTYNSARTACSGDAHCLQTAYLNYLQCLTTSRISYDSCRKVNYMNSSNLFATCHTNASNAGDTLLKPVLRLQDMYDNAPIEASDWKNTNLRHSSFTKYDTSISPLGFAYPGRTQLISLTTPSGTFSAATVASHTISKDSRYLEESTYKFSAGNPQQVLARDGVPIAYVWDYRNTQPIAKVSNATVDQVAYTSFESDGNGSWSIPSGARDTFSITGAKSYNLSNGGCVRAGLSSGSTYVVSYWSKTGSSFTVTGSAGYTQGKTIAINGANWTYFEHKVTGASSVTVSGTGDIDELRLYPATAQMTTYTYSPLIGMSSQCDIDNRISYYTYDGLGRLKVVKDQDGNVVKTIQYHYQGQ